VHETEQSLRGPSQFAVHGASAACGRYRSEAVDVDRGQFVGRGLKDVAIVMRLDELTPVGGRSPGRRDGRWLERLAEVCENLPYRARLGDERNQPDVAAAVRWTPIFGRPDKVEFPGWEAPYQEQDDGWEATSVWTGFQGENGLSSRQRTSLTKDLQA
jgi:hypothetical protein